MVFCALFLISSSRLPALPAGPSRVLVGLSPKAGRAAEALEVARIGPRQLQRGRTRRGQREFRLVEILRPEIRRVGIGDVLRQNLLTLLMPLHAGAEHREDRYVGNGHEPSSRRWFASLGRLCRVYG